MEKLKKQISQITAYASYIILIFGFCVTYRNDTPLFYDSLIIIFIPIGFLVFIIRLIRDTEPRWGIYGTIAFSFIFSISMIVWGIGMRISDIQTSTMSYEIILLSGIIGLIVNIIGLFLVSDTLLKLLGAHPGESINEL